MISQKPTPVGVSILLTYSILRSLNEISQVSSVRTIAECYFKMLKIKVLSVFMFCLNCLFFIEGFTRSIAFNIVVANVQKSICKISVKRFFLFKFKRMSCFLKSISFALLWFFIC